MEGSSGDADPPYIMSAYLRGLFDHLRARGAPVEPVLEVMGLSERELFDPERRIEHSLQNAIFEAAERVTSDENVGLHAGEATHLMHFGIGGMLAMTCKTLRELIDVHVRFQRLISTGASMRYVEVGDELVGEVTFVDPTPLSRHTLEYTLASHMTLARLMTGLPVTAARIDVMFEAPADRSELERVVGCPVRYGCPQERIYFPSCVLDWPLVIGDSAARPALEFEAERRLESLRPRLADDDPEIAALKRFVVERLHTSRSSVDDAASALGISARTLQRKLEARGSNYRRVVDEVRRELAQKYIVTPSLSQVDIAYLLGFSEQSAFHRSFRRWFGATPGEYRARRLQLE